MTKIIDLPQDVVVEVLSRVPVTSLRAVRFTCSKWNTFTTDECFMTKQINQTKAAPKKKQVKVFHVILTMNFKAYLMSVDLHGLLKDDNVESSIQTKGKLVCLKNGDRVVEDNVLHCDGLLLCITSDSSRLVVWNPFCGQTRWIEHRDASFGEVNYALGYEMKNKSHRSNKILKFVDAYCSVCEFEIYHFDSNSWKAIEVTPESIILLGCGVTLKGNTYWGALDQEITRALVEEEISEFLLCFDFTTEKFGPRLPLPFSARRGDHVILSSVREKNLAVLFQKSHMGLAEIWISNKIEANAVSWDTKVFLQFDVGFGLQSKASFFVDHKNKVVVLFNKERYHKDIYYPKPEPTNNTAYIFGEDDYSQKVDLGLAMQIHSSPIVCSYVPSSAQIEQLAPGDY